jgi:hypothetical protein
MLGHKFVRLTISNKRQKKKKKREKKKKKKKKEGCIDLKLPKTLQQTTKKKRSGRGPAMAEISHFSFSNKASSIVGEDDHQFQLSS